MAELPPQDVFSPEEYYASLQPTGSLLKQKFQNIDDPDHFAEYMKRLRNPSTNNFVLDFGNEDAFCATDMRLEDFKTLFSKKVGASVHTVKTTRVEN